MSSSVTRARVTAPPRKVTESLNDESDTVWRRTELLAVTTTAATCRTWHKSFLRVAFGRVCLQRTLSVNEKQAVALLLLPENSSRHLWRVPGGYGEGRSAFKYFNSCVRKSNSIDADIHVLTTSPHPRRLAHPHPLKGVSGV